MGLSNSGTLSDRYKNCRRCAMNDDSHALSSFVVPHNLYYVVHSILCHDGTDFVFSRVFAARRENMYVFRVAHSHRPHDTNTFPK